MYVSTLGQQQKMIFLCCQPEKENKSYLFKYDNYFNLLVVYNNL